ncbi:MAG: WYL domain-containing protein [Gammaproteobacteria bacterium]|nr:WYL domain-containing protein [Gammaproteobacteria bacterium]
MDRFDRIFALHRILAGRRTPISRQELQEKLECSRATIGRLIEDMRAFLSAPIEYDREHNGYRYNHAEAEMYELPGLWLNSSELFALLVSQKLLAEVQPGLLAPQLDPLRERIHGILRTRRVGHPQTERRIRILQMAARPADLEKFQKIATALLDRRQLHIFYRGRARDEFSERDVSPQRLVYYRDNWYLDAWCHWRRGLRSFSVDRMEPRYVSEDPAREVDEESLEAHYTAAYGIFAGPADKTAILRFSSKAAKWVADEHWHSKQAGKMLPSGEYELRVPYGNPTELIMDILKYGERVEVMAPAALRREVARRLREAAEGYRSVKLTVSPKVHRGQSFSSDPNPTIIKPGKAAGTS